MAKFIRQERLKDAVLALSDWRAKVQSQTCQHLFPFLALIKKSAGKRQAIPYEEADDFAFYDQFMRVGSAAKKPYFDPLTRQFRIDTHPHSNVATSRKGTFELKWKAISSEQIDGVNIVTFADNAFEILAERAFMRSGQKTRVNLIDLAVWLYRSESFLDEVAADDLRGRFRADFPMSDSEFNTLFEFHDEPASSIFSDLKLEQADIQTVISEIELSPEAKEPASAKALNPEQSELRLDDDDSVLADVLAILALGSSGIVFRGAPGTGKSWYAMQIALHLTSEDRTRVHRIQFHPSYGYEDFVEGFVPDDGAASGFGVKGKILLDAIDAARQTEGRVVLIVDEINRGDTSRVFGELLTYIEHGWREVPFNLRLSGRTISVPRNLTLLATMNPHDRSITQLDMALLRRFDQVDIAPSREVAANFLLSAGFSVESANLISGWFEDLQELLPFGVGHAFFKGVGDIGALGIMWRYRLLPFCESILEFEPERLTDVSKSFEALVERLRSGGAAAAAT